MIKVLIWRVSNNTSFQDKAIKILEQQHDGIEIVGNATTEEIAKVNGWGGIIIFSSLSAQRNLEFLTRIK